MIKVKYDIATAEGESTKVREGYLIPGVISGAPGIPPRVLLIDKETGEFVSPYAAEVSAVDTKQLEFKQVPGVTLNQGRRVAFTPDSKITDIKGASGYFIAYVHDFRCCLIEGDNGKHYTLAACDVEFPER